MLSRLTLAWSSSGREASASSINSGVGFRSSAAGITMLSSGTICTSSSHELTEPVRLSAFLRTASCCATLVCAINKSSLAAETSACCSSDLDRRERSQLHLPLVVFKKLLGGFERLLLDAEIVVEAHQVPVQIENRGNRGDHLELESQIAHLQIVLGDAYIAVVYRDSPALEQILRDVQVDIALRIGIQRVHRTVDRAVIVHKRKRRGGSGRPRLRVLSLEGPAVVDQRGNAAQSEIAQRRGRVREVGV